jgi:hypothetical protein
MQPDERVIHGKKLAADFFGILWKLSSATTPAVAPREIAPATKLCPS